MALLTSDESLVEAVHMAQRAGWKRLVLVVDVVKRQQHDGNGSVVSVASSAASGSNVAGPKPRNRLLTKVEEMSSSESSDDSSSEEEIVRRKSKKARRKNRDRGFSLNSNQGLIAGGAATLVVGLGAIAIMLMRRK